MYRASVYTKAPQRLIILYQVQATETKLMKLFIMIFGRIGKVEHNTCSSEISEKNYQNECVIIR